MLLIGHRGAAGLAPENSIEAIRVGLAGGCNGIEIDIQQTADRQTIVMHDRTIDRTTTGKGKIRQLRYTALEKVRLRNFGTASNVPQTIPLFTDVLKEVKPTNVLLIVELKNPSLYPHLVRDAIDTIRAWDMADRAMLFSFNRKAIEEVKAIDPKIKTGLFIFGFENFKGIKTDYICPFFGGVFLFPNLIKRIHAAGAVAFVWTVNSSGLMRWLLRKEADGIITNRPDIFNTTFLPQ
jgi:glycerophosphoryl diester phosphodiesterase